MKKSLLLILPLILSGIVALSQAPIRNCGTMDYLQQQINEDPSVQTGMDNLEQWTENWIKQNPNHDQKSIITIPVVVHVIYKTASQNISDARVQEQINVLNTDFSGQNVHSMEAFSSTLKVNTNIQFCLAQQTPSGTATNGIERRQSSTKFINGSNPNGKEKHYSTGGLDAWDVTKYFNIWVCDQGSSLAGYAQFPGSGINSTYGVSINYRFFGLTGAIAPYNLGGTASHEVGHCFNLYHIWGDDGGSCNGSDNCADTPNQGNYTYGSHSGVLTDNCTTTSPGIMYMNFMDYSDDIDYTNFTPDQNSRMQPLFVPGGLLYSLTYSNGCEPPTPGACGTPSGLYASSITVSSTTLSWTAVSGAISYNIQYRVAGTSTWTSTTSSTNSKSLSGLTDATTYEYQVQTVCSTGSSNYSSIASFTTLSSSGGGCIDNYESNETLSTAASLPINTDVDALISSSTDNDYFVFSNQKNKRNIVVTLTNEPEDYDLDFFNSNGTLLLTLANGSTGSEGLYYNNAPYGTYYIRIYGHNGVYSATSCYTITANVNKHPYKYFNLGEVPGSDSQDAFAVYPNPASDEVTINYNTDMESNVTINIMDITGRIILTNSFDAVEGFNNYSLNVKSITDGNYIIELNDGDRRIYQRLMIAK